MQNETEVTVRKRKESCRSSDNQLLLFESTGVVQSEFSRVVFGKNNSHSLTCEFSEDHESESEGRVITPNNLLYVFSRTVQRCM